MRVLVTGGSGVLGRALIPRLMAAGHQVDAPARQALSLFDADALAGAVAGTEAIYHLATAIPPRERQHDPDAWRMNDRLRAEASRLLVDAALQAKVAIFVLPTVALMYPPGAVDEDTPLVDVPFFLASAVAAEREVARFAAAGGTGVVLRLGLLDGPGTGLDARNPAFGATLHADDAGRALFAALGAPGGVYNVVRDGDRVSNARFRRATGWRPLHS